MESSLATLNVSDLTAAETRNGRLFNFEVIITPETRLNVLKKGTFYDFLLANGEKKRIIDGIIKEFGKEEFSAILDGEFTTVESILRLHASRIIITEGMKLASNVSIE